MSTRMSSGQSIAWDRRDITTRLQDMWNRRPTSEIKRVGSNPTDEPITSGPAVEKMPSPNLSNNSNVEI